MSGITDGFPPRWECGEGWADAPWVGWLTIVSDLVIAGSYFAIPVMLVLAMRMRERRTGDATPGAVRLVLLLFAAFIICCGVGHVLDALLFWWPAYPLVAVWAALTALVSAVTASQMPRVLLEAGRARSGGEFARMENQFEGIFEASSIGLALVSLEGQWLRVNRAVEEMLGRTAAELAGLGFQDVTHPDDLGKDMSMVQRVIDGLLPRYTMLKRYIRADRRVVHVRLTVSMARDEDGNALHFLSQIEDRSEEVRLLELERSRAHALQEAHDALQARMEEREGQDGELRDEALSAAMRELDEVLHDLKAEKSGGRGGR